MNGNIILDRRVNFIEALLWFILGVCFESWVRPVLDSLSSYLVAQIDSRTAKAQIGIAKANEEIQNIQQPETASNLIGFQMPSEEEYYYDDDEDDDDDI